MYILYTDGSCKGNGKVNSVGAWAYILLENGKEIQKESQANRNTTNNKMELMAVIKGIEAILDKANNFLIVKFLQIVIIYMNAIRKNGIYLGREMVGKIQRKSR